MIGCDVSFITSKTCLIYNSLEIVYASDDEGNSFNNVVFDPSLIYLNGHDSIAEEDLKEFDEDDIKKCICIN